MKKNKTMGVIKVNKEFCVSDSSVNCYGYRLLTSGFQQDKFNPAIGFLMHDRKAGVIIKWENIRIENDKIFATPVLNAEHPRAQSLAEEINNGFYAAASVGHIVPIETSDDITLKLTGQTEITVTKWYCKEISIVDIPGNSNALAKLYDENGNILRDLKSDIEVISNNFVKKITKILELDENTNEKDILQTIQTLKDIFIISDDKLTKILELLELEKESETDIIIEEIKKIKERSLNNVETAFKKGLINKNEFSLLKQLNDNNEINEFLQGKTKELQNLILGELSQAMKERKLTFQSGEILKNIGIKIGLPALKEYISTLPPQMLIKDLINENNTKKNWGLNEYRKYAPEELRENPQLYSDLIEREKALTSL